MCVRETVRKKGVGGTDQDTDVEHPGHVPSSVLDQVVEKRDSRHQDYAIAVGVAPDARQSDRVAVLVVESHGFSAGSNCVVLIDANKARHTVGKTSDPDQLGEVLVGSDEILDKQDHGQEQHDLESACHAGALVLSGDGGEQGIDAEGREQHVRREVNKGLRASVTVDIDQPTAKRHHPDDPTEGEISRPKSHVLVELVHDDDQEETIQRAPQDQRHCTQAGDQCD